MLENEIISMKEVIGKQIEEIEVKQQEIEKLQKIHDVYSKAFESNLRKDKDCEILEVRL